MLGTCGKLLRLFLASLDLELTLVEEGFGFRKMLLKAMGFSACQAEIGFFSHMWPVHRCTCLYHL